jgi:hypothetical protein
LSMAREKNGDGFKDRKTEKRQQHI